MYVGAISSYGYYSRNLSLAAALNGPSNVIYLRNGGCACVSKVSEKISVSTQTESAENQIELKSPIVRKNTISEEAKKTLSEQQPHRRRNSSPQKLATPARNFGSGMLARAVYNLKQKSINNL